MGIRTDSWALSCSPDEADRRVRDALAQSKLEVVEIKDGTGLIYATGKRTAMRHAVEVSIDVQPTADGALVVCRLGMVAGGKLLLANLKNAVLHPVTPSPATPAGPAIKDPSPATSAGPAIKDRSRLHQKANDALDKNLSAGEHIEVIVTGPSNQAVIGTDRRVFVYKKGFMAGATFGSEMTSWDYRNLNGVQVHTGAMSGALVLQAPGQSGVKTSSWKQGDSDPYKAPNAIPLVRPWEQAQEGAARLRQLIEAAQGVQPTPPTMAVPSPSLADEIHKLAALRESGALDEDEFRQAKQALINKNS